MNSDHEIYKAPADQIPEEDKARLDGYLAARAEADEAKRRLAELQQVGDRLEGMKGIVGT